MRQTDTSVELLVCSLTPEIAEKQKAIPADSTKAKPHVATISEKEMSVSSYSINFLAHSKKMVGNNIEGS